jgi:hypothetical protein
MHGQHSAGRLYFIEEMFDLNHMSEQEKPDYLYYVDKVNEGYIDPGADPVSPSTLIREDYQSLRSRTRIYIYSRQRSISKNVGQCWRD